MVRTEPSTLISYVWRMQKFLITTMALVAMLLWTNSTAAARTPTSFLPVSLSYAWPGGGLSDDVAPNPALGFSLGYRYGTSRHLHLSARATWMRMTLGTVDTIDYTGFGLTHIGLLGGVQYRFLKHGVSPYVEGEVGMGIMFADKEVANIPQRIDELTEVKVSVAGVVGLLIPISERVNLDVAGRYQITYVSGNFTSIAAHAGIQYALF